jgi:hypothetical protein
MVLGVVRVDFVGSHAALFQLAFVGQHPHLLSMMASKSVSPESPLKTTVPNAQLGTFS